MEMRQAPGSSTIASSNSTSGRAADDSLTHWVKLAFMTMRREMESSLRASGLTLTQWRALGMLLHTPGSTHSDLVKQLEVEAPSVTSLVNGMERKGWVRQERSPEDARVKRLFLTASGRRVIETARVACAPVERRMEASLPEQERDALKRLLRLVVDSLQ
jgi:MarR family transcriptional regulator, transcriptional regulator for hemolysin